MDITSLENRINKLRDKKPKIYSQFQYEVNEVWEMVDKKVAFPILARLAKTKPKEFRRAKDYLYGAIKDGQIFTNKGAYFMWLIKYYGKNGDSKSK
jgi:hypothetical protein